MKTLPFVVLVLFLALILSGCEKKAQKIFSPEKALQIAAQTQEAQALINYRNRALSECLEKKVVRSCESEWVTCRDNAWVVQYVLTSQCPVKSDGRLGMNFVIDGFDGKVISHYPEREYFANDKFCYDNGDCISGTVGENKECLNFIAAPFAHFTPASSTCLCQAGQCILK